VEEKRAVASSLISFQVTVAELGHDMYLRGILPFLKEVF
jgi:hypothetical protein